MTETPKLDDLDPVEQESRNGVSHVLPASLQTRALNGEHVNIKFEVGRPVERWPESRATA